LIKLLTKIGKEKKVVFNPYEFAWTNTEGAPRSLGQLFTKWKGGVSKNMAATDFQSGSANTEAIFDKVLQLVCSGEAVPSYVQVKLQ